MKRGGLEQVRKWLGLLLLSGALWWLDGRGKLSWLRRPVEGMVNPIRQRWFSKQIGGGRDCQTEVEINQAIEAGEILRLREENEAMRKLLGAPLPADWQFIPAKILQLKEKEMVIDGGEEVGMKVGQMVIGVIEGEVKGGVLLGRIKQSLPRQAKVELLNSEEVKVKVKTAGGAEGVVKGSVTGGLRLEEVLQKYSLEEGELIVSLGQDGWRPGLIIGRVGRIEREDRMVFQAAEINRLREIGSWQQVAVVK